MSGSGWIVGTSSFSSDLAAKMLGYASIPGAMPPPSRRMVGAPTPKHLTSSFRPPPTSIRPSYTTSPGPGDADGAGEDVTVA